MRLSTVPVAARSISRASSWAVVTKSRPATSNAQRVHPLPTIAPTVGSSLSFLCETHSSLEDSASPLGGDRDSPAEHPDREPRPGNSFILAEGDPQPGD